MATGRHRNDESNVGVGRPIVKPLDRSPLTASQAVCRIERRMGPVSLLTVTVAGCTEKQPSGEDRLDSRALTTHIRFMTRRRASRVVRRERSTSPLTSRHSYPLVVLRFVLLISLIQPSATAGTNQLGGEGLSLATVKTRVESALAFLAHRLPPLDSTSSSDPHLLVVAQIVGQPESWRSWRRANAAVLCGDTTQPTAVARHRVSGRTEAHAGQALLAAVSQLGLDEQVGFDCRAQTIAQRVDAEIRNPAYGRTCRYIEQELADRLCATPVSSARQEDARILREKMELRQELSSLDLSWLIQSADPESDPGIASAALITDPNGKRRLEIKYAGRTRSEAFIYHLIINAEKGTFRGFSVKGNPYRDARVRAFLQASRPQLEARGEWERHQRLLDSAERFDFPTVESLAAMAPETDPPPICTTCFYTCNGNGFSRSYTWDPVNIELTHTDLTLWWSREDSAWGCRWRTHASKSCWAANPSPFGSHWYVDACSFTPIESWDMWANETTLGSYHNYDFDEPLIGTWVWNDATVLFDGAVVIHGYAFQAIGEHAEWLDVTLAGAHYNNCY